VAQRLDLPAFIDALTADQMTIACARPQPNPQEARLPGFAISSCKARYNLSRWVNTWLAARAPDDQTAG
jgi:hypothetical protein